VFGRLAKDNRWKGTTTMKRKKNLPVVRVAEQEERPGWLALPVEATIAMADVAGRSVKG
jgi:hypothetical protein